MAPDRRAELAANLAAVRQQITRACASAGRDPAEVTLIAITKLFPASDVALLASLGVVDVGENRDQEAAAKASECEGVRWHFVGQLQTNKARSVAGYASVVHSVDRPQLVDALSRAATRTERPLRCLVQVSFDSEPGRGGVAPEGLAELADRLAEAPGLTLGGVMAVAPLGVDPGPSFARLAELSADLRERHPGATWISAGMSDDLTSAITHGATHLRIGRRLLGERPSRR
ncbi:YggS family pyridoxal phosphate enzyme [Flindersiella endophytica]